MIPELQFLDLHDISEDDKNLLMSLINFNEESIKLPWSTSDNKNNVIIKTGQNSEQSGSNGKYININYYIIIIWIYYYL